MRANFKLSAWMLLATLFIFSACRKNFDEPPISELPNLEGNITIAEIKAMAASTPFAMDSTKILEATVVADDASGNFYKQLVLQDSTGGIRIDINAYNLYNDFPVGRKVWVRLGGLFAWQDGDVVSIVGSSDVNDSRIPQALYKQYIIGGEHNHFIAPTTKTLSTLTAADYNTLIKIDDVEFTANFAGGTFANTVTQQSVNAELHECATSGLIIMRNSGYADFAGQITPTGNGSVVAVYNSFNGTRQLFIRNPSDLDMTGTRCTFLPGANSTPMAIDSVRKLFTGTALTAPFNRKIKGIVISDVAGGNWVDQNIVVQEPNGSGILVRFAATHSFNMGDEVEVDISGQVIEEFKGLLQLNGVPLAYAKLKSTGNSITPRVTTIAAIMANANDWESTLVNVATATLNGGTTYGDFGVMLNDASGSISMFSAFSNFTSVALPTGTGDVTAVVGDYNGTQLNIRNLSDVNISGSGGGTGGGGGTGATGLMPIDSLRMLYNGSPVLAPTSRTISGIVISDYVGQNITGKNIVMQNSYGAGIVVRFTANHTVALGDSIVIDISGQELTEYSGIIQLNNVPNANATIISNGHTVTPRTATITDIIANHDDWESTLVKIVGATISGGTTYSGTLSVSDGMAIDMYTRPSATFSGDTVPAGTVSVTAIVSQFNATKQINIRQGTDVQ